MGRWLATTCVSLLALASCARTPVPDSQAPTLASPDSATFAANEDRAKPDKQTPAPDNTPPSRVLATVNGNPITADQLQRPMIDAYGLQFLLHLAQIELCKQNAAAVGLVLTPDDITSERQRTLDQMFKDAVPVDPNISEDEHATFRKKEYDRLLEQFLLTQRISMPEFDLAMQTGAYLRKLAEPGLKEKITEEHAREGFGIMFGEKVRVRHIQLANMREVVETQRRLRNGEPFEKVASELTTDERSRPTGGELRAFSRAEPSWPQAFKDAAFSLKEPGEVSEPVHAGESIHLIKLIQKIPPNKSVSFETHKDYVREQLYNGLLIVRIKQLRESLAAEARSSLKIQDPVLRSQYLQRLERAAGESQRDPNLIRKEIGLDRLRTSSTQPATAPPDQPATAPAEGRRPPATMPGSSHAGPTLLNFKSRPLTPADESFAFAP